MKKFQHAAHIINAKASDTFYLSLCFQIKINKQLFYSVHVKETASPQSVIHESNSDVNLLQTAYLVRYVLRLNHPC